MQPKPLPRASSRFPLIVAVALCAAALVAHSAHAALWKWIDANGRVVYSDIRPSGDVKAERIAGPAPPANPNAAKDMANQEAELKKRQGERAEDAAKQERSKADTARRQEQCAQARGQLKALQAEQIQYYRVNERGERVLMDAATRQKERTKVEAFLREQCSA